MSAKRIIATAIGLPVVVAFGINFENWLVSKKLDDVFTDAEESVSAMESQAWDQINAFMASDFMVGFALAALIFGFWDWIARQPLEVWRRVRREPQRVVVMTKPTLKTFDHDVVAKGLFVRAKRTDDGIDIFPIVAYRNRSTHNIEIKEPKAKYTLDNKKPDRSYSHGFTATIGKMGDANVQFRPVRIYNQDGRASGKVLVQFTYGETKETAQTTIIMRYEFKTLAPPKEVDKEENVPFEHESDIKYERFDNP